MNFLECWQHAYETVTNGVTTLTSESFPIVLSDIHYFHTNPAEGIVDIRIKLTPLESQRGMDSVPYAEFSELEVFVTVGGQTDLFTAYSRAYSTACAIRTLFIEPTCLLLLTIPPKSIYLEEIIGSDYVCAIFTCTIKHEVTNA